MKNAITWFEIPSKDFERAVKFYRSIVKWEFKEETAMWMKMAFFPLDNMMEWVGWSIIYTQNIKPTQDWVTIYLNAWDNIGAVISKIEKNWWKIVMPKMDIWENMWFIAQFIDTEWNRIGLHWMK